MKAESILRSLAVTVACLLTIGCHHYSGVPKEQQLGPPYDRPFPVGQVTDAHWETQQANAEAADFIFYDHEFEGTTARLTPGGRKHLWQIALRLEHVPFPVVIEASPGDRNPQLDAARRGEVLAQLAQLGVQTAEPRVIIAPAFGEGLMAVEGEAAYYSVINSSDFSSGGGTGRRFSGRGGSFR
jgi:hypothetical protein